MLNNKLEILIEGFILLDTSTELEHETDSEQYKEQHTLSNFSHFIHVYDSSLVNDNGSLDDKDEEL